MDVACLSSFSAAHDIVCKLVEGNPLAASVMVLISSSLLLSILELSDTKFYEP